MQREKQMQSQAKRQETEQKIEFAKKNQEDNLEYQRRVFMDRERQAEEKRKVGALRSR